MQLLAILFELFQLSGILNLFCNYSQRRVVVNLNNGPHERGAVQIRLHVPHERLIHLDLVESQLRKVRQT